MAVDLEVRSGNTDDPLLSHLVFIKMEDVMDKLKLLDYEKEFCRKLKLRPIPRHYFAVPTNSGEQFHVFTNLAIWLINLCGCHLEQPQEFDDPNATIATIIAESKKQGVATNFPPMKLKTGAGEKVCHILSDLADCALAKTGFQWKKPTHTEDDAQDEIIEEGHQELSLSRMEEEIQEDVNESDEEEPVFLDLTMMEHVGSHESTTVKTLDEALETTVDPEQWRQEVERVMPSLKVRFRQDNRDWRLHYDQMHQYHGNIKTVLSDTKDQLDKLHAEIAKTLEKIGSREKYINQQLESHIQAFRSSQDNLAQVRNKYKEGSHNVNDLSRKLAEISAELESVKIEMDEKGTSMTDAGPVVRIKQALTKLKNESLDMEVQIGLLEHTLLEVHFKTRSALKFQMSAGTRTSKHNTLFL